VIKEWLFGQQGGVMHSDVVRLLRRESFSEFLPWVAYDAQRQAYLNSDETRGYLWACSPLAFAALKDLGTLEGLLRIDFPKQTVLQVILYADPNIDGYIARYQAGKTRRDALTQRNINEYASFLRSGVQGVEKLNGIPLRNFRCCIALKSPELIDEDDLTTIEEALSGLGMQPQRMHPCELLAWMRQLFNQQIGANPLAYDETVPINKQVIVADTKIEDSDTHLTMGNSGAECYVRCLTPKLLPRETDSLATNTLCGGIMGVMEDNSQINTPFLWSLNILFDEQLKGQIHTKASMTMMQQASGSFAVQIKKRNEEFAWALSEMENNRFVRILPSLVLFGRSEQEVRIATARARRIWEAQNYVMQEETIIRRAIFILSLPCGLFSGKDNIRILDRDFPVPANVAVRMMPCQADFSGTLHNPVLSFVGRKGQVIGVDVFDSRSNNHNFLVTAGSGAGKSFSLNALLANYYASESMVRVVDLGYSYQKLCRTVGGRFMDFGKERVTINPFISNAKDEEDKQFDATATTHVVAEMVYSSSGQALRETEWTLLKDAVRYAFETDPINGIDAVSDYLAHFPRFAQSDVKEYEQVGKEIAKYMAFNLRDFKSTGIYGPFFNGPSTFNIQFDDFVVLELEKLKPQKELFKVVTMQVLNAITQDLYWSDRSHRRFILFEEAWSFFDSGNRIGTLIEEGYRRARKYFGSFGIVTQSYLDLEKFGPSGDVIRANAAYKFLMESEDYREAAKKNLLDYEGLALELVASIKNNKPRYSELFLDTPYGKGPARLVVDPWNYWVATSAGDEVKKFMTLLSQTDDVVQVIETLSGCTQGVRKSHAAPEVA